MALVVVVLFGLSELWAHFTRSFLSNSLFGHKTLFMTQKIQQNKQIICCSSSYEVIKSSSLGEFRVISSGVRWRHESCANSSPMKFLPTLQNEDRIAMIVNLKDILISHFIAVSLSLNYKNKFQSSIASSISHSPWKRNLCSWHTEIGRIKWNKSTILGASVFCICVSFVVA